MEEISDQAIFKSILVWVLIMVDWVESSISGSGIVKDQTSSPEGADRPQQLLFLFLLYIYIYLVLVILILMLFSCQNMKGVEEVIMFLINLKEVPIGMLVCMGRKMKEMVTGSFSSSIRTSIRAKP